MDLAGSDGAGFDYTFLNDPAHSYPCGDRTHDVMPRRLPRARSLKRAVRGCSHYAAARTVTDGRRAGAARGAATRASLMRGSCAGTVARSDERERARSANGSSAGAVRARTLCVLVSAYGRGFLSVSCATQFVGGLVSYLQSQPPTLGKVP